MDWTSFFLGAVGAAATLMGLLFVGVQFHMDTLMADLRWQAVARSTFAMYVILFLTPLVLVIPTLDTRMRALFLLGIAAFGTLRTVRTWLPVWRSRQQRESERVWQSLWLLVGPVVAYLSLANAAIRLFNAANIDLVYTDIALTLVGFFALVLRNSWNLLFEIAAEKQRGQ